MGEPRVVNRVRTAAYDLALAVWTLSLGLLALPMLVLPRPVLIAPVRLWARGALGFARLFCGIRWTIEGLEHIPKGPVLLIGRHESAWDTMIFLLLHPDPAYVLKKELLKIPVYGWFANKVGMIAIDRAAGAKALRGLVRDAVTALQAGRAVIIFPEGTRMEPGRTRKIQPGAAALYEAAVRAAPVDDPGPPVLLFSLVSGHVWNTRRKCPGLIRLRIHPPLPQNLDRAGFLAAVEQAVYADSRALARAVGAIAPSEGEDGTLAGTPAPSKAE